jgi:indole-3-glycerol phosphate synthase
MSGTRAGAAGGGDRGVTVAGSGGGSGGAKVAASGGDRGVTVAGSGGGSGGAKVAGSGRGNRGVEVGDRATVLADILAHTRETLERRRRDVPIDVLQDQAAAGPGGRGRLRAALARPGIGVIAEFKRRSPSAGELRPGADVRAIASAYEQAGASAISVLTEQDNFAGSLADLRAARAACSLPILRKDFIVDPYQLYEARAAGADAVLLIVAALQDGELAELQERARALGLDTLVEVHDRDELTRAAAIDPKIVGVNNRDLRDFSVDVRRTAQLLAEMPPGVLVVSESGIATREQVRELERQGVAAVLVGEALMRAPDPGQALAGLLG